MKEELDKTGHELIELRKTKAEQLQIIDDLKVEWLTLKLFPAVSVLLWLSS